MRSPWRVPRAVTGALATILAAMLWMAVAWVLSLAWHGAPVPALALVGTVAGAVAARRSRGRIAAVVGRIDPW